MNRNNENAEILNDLIQINNDRIEGYERAVKDTGIGDNDLRGLFQSMANESRQYVAELQQYVVREGEEPAKDTTVRGKIYRAWMDVKATFSGHDRKSILESCEYGEDAAQRAYERALEDSEDVSPDVANLIMDQKMKLRQSHDKIRALRDRQHA
jgi:uncharacterized protein (TIGR02284 family)